MADSSASLVCLLFGLWFELVLGRPVVGQTSKAQTVHFTWQCATGCDDLHLLSLFQGKSGLFLVFKNN